MDGLYKNKIAKSAPSTANSGAASGPAPFTPDAAGRISRHFTPEVSEQMTAEIDAAGRGTLNATEIYGRYVAWMFNQEGYSADLTIRAFISEKGTGYGSAVLAKETGLDVIISAIINRVPEAVGAYIRSGVLSEETLVKYAAKSQSPENHALIIPAIEGWKASPNPLSTEAYRMSMRAGSYDELYKDYIVAENGGDQVFILGRVEDFDEKTLSLFSNAKKAREAVTIDATFNEYEGVIDGAREETYFADRSSPIVITFPKPLNSY
jgi:hypothetical protein